MLTKIFKPQINDDLMTSQLYCDQSFYTAFKKDLKQAREEVLIESPFMAIRRTADLLPILEKLTSKGVKVRINTRNPKHHDNILSGQAWKVIQELRAIGVDVRFYNDYRHRKLAVIDRLILWEGSLNILSQSNSKEIMRRTKSTFLANQVIKFTKMDSWRWF